jgi:purine-binding chemotaxis protein CheW
MSAYCVFNVGDRRIGIPMTSVREILGKELIALTPLPLVPDFMDGVFNLRGQVLPLLNLSGLVGAKADGEASAADRAVVVERGGFRFATLGRQIDTLEAGEDALRPVEGAALYPALEAEAHTERGNFQVIHLDRLEACLTQSLKFAEVGEPVRAAAHTN